MGGYYNNGRWHDDNGNPIEVLYDFLLKEGFEDDEIFFFEDNRSTLEFIEDRKCFFDTNRSNLKKLYSVEEVKTFFEKGFPQQVLRKPFG